MCVRMLFVFVHVMRYIYLMRFARFSSITLYISWLQNFSICIYKACEVAEQGMCVLQELSSIDTRTQHNAVTHRAQLLR